MSVSKTKNRLDPIWFDTSIKYVVPMMPQETSIYDYTEYPVEVYITQEPKGTVCVVHEGYKSKYFEDRSFEFLLYTGYIKRCSK